MPARVCARQGCNTRLTSMRVDAVWCSRACYIAAKRARKGLQSPDVVAGLNQRDRVLRALQLRGPDGVTQEDLVPPGVVDGGPPVYRLGARVHDLRTRGHVIRTAGKRGGFIVYVLEPGA